MNNTEVLKTIKHLMQNTNNEKMAKYGIALLLQNNPTIKQLSFLKKIIQVNKTIYLCYSTLINDMIEDFANNTIGESLNEYKLKYKLN